MGTFLATQEGMCQAFGTEGQYGIAYCDVTTTTTSTGIIITTSTTTDMPWGWPWWAWFLICIACCLVLGICGGGAATALQPKGGKAKAPEMEYYTDYVVEDVDGPGPEDSPLMESQPGMATSGSAYPYSTGTGGYGGPTGGTFPGAQPTATFGGP